MAKKFSRPRHPDFSEEKILRIRKRQILLGSFLILLGFLMTVSFVSFLFHHQSDQSTLEVFFEKEVQSQNLLNKIVTFLSINCLEYLYLFSPIYYVIQVFYFFLIEIEKI